MTHYYGRPAAPPAGRRAMSDQPAAIPYDEIDIEVRRLVWLMNQLPGIVTLWSCAGHAEDEPSYVTFTAETQEALGEVLCVLPFQNAQMAVVGNRMHYTTLTVAARIDLDGHLVYDLHVGGTPKYVQRQLLGELERALADYLSPTPPHSAPSE